MAGLQIIEGGPGAPPFTVVPLPDTVASATEMAWCHRINDLLAKLTAPDTDRAATPSPEAIKERDRFIARLRQRAERVCAAAPAQRETEAAEALRDTDWDEGVYTDRLARLAELPFTVKPIYNPASGLINDIEVETRDKPIPAEKQQFKVQLDQAVTVVKTVFSEIDVLDRAVAAEPTRWDRFWAGLKRLMAPPPTVHDAFRLSEYLRTLLGIAQVGLMGQDASQTPFAVLALTGFKNEFVAREAGRVKNRYIRRLGVSATVATIGFILCYAATLLLAPADWIFYRFRNFFVLAASAAVGTWLSFSIRRQVLGFEDLATLEDDRLNPGVRVLFIVALTTVVGLILWTGMVTVVIGTFRTDFRQTGSYAALIGALCGIAERSLTGAVSKRASELVAGIGGTTKPAA